MTQLLALSIWQPWAWLIANGHKDLENRDWPTKFRGPFLIQASKTIDAEAIEELRNHRHPVTGKPVSFDLPAEFERGGIVGQAEIVDCVTASRSPWFVGKFGFLIRNARPLPFQACRGQLGFFAPDFFTAPAVDPKVPAQGMLL